MPKSAEVERGTQKTPDKKTAALSDEICERKLPPF
jgi:hypothetical protein